MVAFFIDSADRPSVEVMLATGLFAGVTTNPAILDKVGLGSSDIPDVVAWACAAGAERVFVQSWGSSVAEMEDRAEGFRRLNDRVVVKVPANRMGIEAARHLSNGGEVLVTAAYSAIQVLPVLASGARYVAPFVARMLAAGRPAIEEILQMQKIIDKSVSHLEILAGSLRTPEQILALAAGGVQNITMGTDVWDAFFDDDLTAASVRQFEQLASAS